MRAAVAILLALFPFAAFGQSVGFSHSGYLLGAGDLPVSATVPMQFALYPAATGGVALWTSQSCPVTVKNGYYTVLLGYLGCDGTPALDASLLVPTGAPRFLAVTVDTTPLLPRQALGPGLAAIDAALLGGKAPADYVLRTDLAALGSGAIDASRITSGTLPDARLSANVARLPVTTTQAFSGAIQAPAFLGDGSLVTGVDAAKLGGKTLSQLQSSLKIGLATTCGAGDGGTLSWDGTRLLVCDGAGGWLAVSGTSPDAPTSLAATAGDGLANLTWTAPASDGGRSVTNYEVTVTPAAGVTGATTRLTGSATAAFAFTGLTNGTAYTFTVKAVNAIGKGVASGSASTTPRALPSAPATLVAAAGNTKVTLTWTAPASDGGVAITGYQLTATRSGFAPTTSTVAASPLSATLSSLVNGALYTFSVAALNGTGTGAAASVTATPTAQVAVASLRFNPADTAYLSRTPAAAGNQKTYTLAYWFKRAAKPGLGIAQFGRTTDASNYFLMGPGALNNNTDAMEIGWANGSTVAGLKTTRLFNNLAVWHHVVLRIDTTQAVAGDRLRLYVDGVQLTSFATSTYPAQNTDLPHWNTALEHRIGNYPGSTLYNNDGYMTEVHFVDGQSLNPTSFGQTDTAGAWRPRAYAGTYGTNGFQLKFADASAATAAALGKDTSGNVNNWAPNNFSVTAGAGNDVLADVPNDYDDGANGRGNYAILDVRSLLGASTLPTVSDGNLVYADTAVSQWHSATATLAVPQTGKWYQEYRITSVPNVTTQNYSIGYAKVGTYASPVPNGGEAGKINFWINGTSPARSLNGVLGTAYGTLPAVNDVVMVAADRDANKIWFGLNGGWFASGNPVTGANAAYVGGFDAASYLPCITSYAYSGGTALTTQANFGQRPFSYAPPAGFKALHSGNLP